MRLENTLKFSKDDINKSILVFILLSKWMIGKSLMKQHYLKRVCEDSEIKNLGECQDLCLKYTLPLVDVFENFRKMCLTIYDLDLVKLHSIPGLHSKQF